MVNVYRHRFNKLSIFNLSDSEIPKSIILLLIPKSINLSSMNQNSRRIFLHNIAKNIYFH